MTGSFKTRRDSTRVEEWLTVTQAADLLGVAAHTLREWTAKGVVEASRTAGGHRRYRRADLERFRTARAEADSLEDVFHRLTELSILADVSETVFSQLELEELLRVVCEKLTQAVVCHAAVISYYDAEAGTVVTLADFNGEGSMISPKGEVYVLAEYPETGRVVRSQTHYLANLSDPDCDPSERDFLESRGNRSLLIMPLVYKGQTIGIVELFDRARERNYSPGELALARAICDRVAVAVYNARVFETLRRQNEELSLLLDIGMAFVSSTDLPETLETIARRLTEVVGVAWCDIYDYDDEKRALRVAAYYQVDELPPSEGWEQTTLALDAWPDFRRVIEERAPVVTQVDDPALPEENRAAMGVWSERSSLTVPLLFQDRIIGVMDLAESRWRREFSEGDIRLVTATAGQAAIAIRNATAVKRLAQQNRELQLLLDTSEVISSSVDLQESLMTITSWLTKTLDVAWADIYDYDSAGDVLRVIAFYQIESVPAADGWLGTTYSGDLLGDWRRCIREQRAVAIYADDPGLPPQDVAEMDKWGEKSTLTVPLVYRDEVIGLLDVGESRYLRRYTDDEGRLLSAIANQLGVALHNLRLFDTARRRNTELSAMLRITEAAGSSEGIAPVLETVTRTVLDSLGVSWCEVYDFAAADALLRVAAKAHLEPLDLEGWDGVYRLDDVPVIARAVREKQAVVMCIDDADLPEATHADMQCWGYQSALYVPMVYSGEVVGVMFVAENRELRRFSDDDVRLASVIASQGAAAMEAARSYAREQADHEQLAKLNRRLNALVEFSAQLRGLVEVDDLIGLLGRVATEALGFRFWAVYLYDADSQSFHASRESGAQAAYVQPIVPGNILEGLTADATRISSSFFVDHRYHEWTDEEDACFPPYDLGGKQEGGWQSEDTLLVPLATDQGELLGYFEVYDPVDGQLPTEETVRQIEIFAGKAASNIELQRLYKQLAEQATTDGLTGLYNHRHLLERVEEEVAKAKRYGTPLSLLMIDIDDFKPFNDSYGHPQGDKLLQEMADILRAGVRQKVDLVARYGGEEFVVLLPSTPSGGAEVAAERLREDIGDPRTAEAVAEAIRKAMADSRFEGYPRRKEVSVTVSIGVASYPSQAGDAGELIANSDRALYVAKRLGKNKTCVFVAD